MSEPLVDIVMLTHSQLGWADLAIRAVEMNVKNSYRLIVVDSASPHPKAKEFYADVKKRGHTVVHLPENRSFSNGNNSGIRAGTAKNVVILNDDCMITEGAIDALIQDLTDERVGLVGARTNYAAGPTGDASWPSSVEPPFMTFVCVAFRREVFEKVGPMDEERFTGWSGEDLDWCWQIRKAGYKLKVSDNAYVLHVGTRSIAATVTGDALGRSTPAMNAHNEKYLRVLEEKWGKEWMVANSKLRQRVLVVSYHAEEWTRVRFAGSLVELKGSGMLPGSGIGPDALRYGFSYYQHTRTPIHLARQAVCDYAFQKGYDILVQFDDDATFPPDVIIRLLAHQKDVVCAAAFQRKPPYIVCAYEDSGDGLTGNTFEGKPFIGTGLRQVFASGFHCSAIRLSVIGKMKAAGVKEFWGGFDKLGEDFAFSANLRKVGVPMYVDTDLVSGHIAQGQVIDRDYKQAFMEGRAK